MNALIKFIITSIIGLFGPLETDIVNQGNVSANLSPVLEILYIDPDANIFCGFDELSCKKLKNNISS